MWLRRAAVALISALVVTAVPAQLKETVTVSVVEVPVTVVGADGKAVRGLAAANFELWDDGKKRMISGFDAIDFASPGPGQPGALPAGTSATAPMNPAARRNFMLLFDLSYSNPNSLLRAKTAAGEFVSKSVNPRDRVSVATLDVNHGFRLLTAFTTDRNAVRQAIADPADFQGSDPLQVTAVGPTLPVTAADGAENSFDPTPRQANLAAAANVERTLSRRSGDFDDQYRRQQVDRQLEILAMISRTMHTVVGRKEIVLLSEGFDPRLVQGRKPMTKEAKEDIVSAERGEIWKVNTDQVYGNTGSQSLLSRFRDMCRRSDVVLNAIDILGLRGPNDPQTGAEVSNEGLHLLADAGGGQVFKNSNDIASSFDRMMKQQEVTYILSFKAPTGNPGSFHNLKVKVVDVPAGTRVSNRTGYYEAGAGSDAERALATAEIMVNDIPQPDLRVDSLPSVFPRGGERAAVPVVVDIDGPGLMRLKDDPIVVAEVFVYAFDSNGTVRDSLFQRLTIDTEKLAAKLSTGGVKYLGTLVLPPGQYAIKTLVRLPELGRNGFVRRDVVVPEKAAASITPPLFFEDASQWVLVKGTSHDPTGAYPFVVGDSMFVPAATARLRSGEKRRFVVFVPNAPGNAAVDVSPAGAALVERAGDAFVFDIDGAVVQAVNLEATLRGSTAKSAVVVQTP